jgi:hypothetical protein
MFAATLDTLPLFPYPAIPFGSMDCLLPNGRDGMGYRLARRSHFS